MNETLMTLRDRLAHWFAETIAPVIDGQVAPWLGENLGPWFEANAYLVVSVDLALVTALLLVLPVRLLRGRARGPDGAPDLPAPELESTAAPEAEAARVADAPAAPEPELDTASEPEALLDATPEFEPEPEPAPEPAPEPELEPEPVAAPSDRLRDRLTRTSQAFVGRLSGILGGRSVDEELLEDLESLLFTADLGVATAESLLEEVRTRAAAGDADKVKQVLREAIERKLERIQPSPEDVSKLAAPHVILVLGVNGSGKTTTIGKLAARYTAQGKKVLLGAGDTFRAAATEQLQIWGERAGCDVIAGQAGGDPASVAFDTVKAAIARKADIAIIDTAGRLQTKRPLMEELAKINRVIGRDIPGAPHECLLVLDSNTGQNAISQAREFTEVATVTGLVLTKLDGTAKGGVIIGLADEFGIPVKYVGVGEGVEDLRDFDATEFVEALFDVGS